MANSRISEQPEDEAADVGEVGHAAAAADRLVSPAAPNHTCSTNQKPSTTQRRQLDQGEEEDDEDSVSTRARGYSTM